MAFFNTAGIERLYSGVKKRSPSAATIFSRNVTHSCGGVASKSSLNIGRLAIFSTSRESDSGASAINALAVFRLNDSFRRLPTITAILYFFIIFILVLGHKV